MKKLLFLFFVFSTSIYPGVIKVKLDDNRSADIYYEITGEGEPIVILHRASSGYLEPIFKDLKRWQRIYIDPPGIGKSSADEWISNSDDCLEIILNTIDQLLPEKKILIAGFSYFGYLARGVIAEREKLINGALLICPVIYPNYSERTIPQKLYANIDSVFFNSLNESEKKLIEGFASINNESFYTAKNYTRNDVMLNQEFWEKIKKNNYSLSFDPDEKINLFEKPSLIFAGQQDNVVGYEDLSKLFPVFRNTSFIISDYASHNLPFEQFNLLKFHINQWLTKIKN